MFSHSRRLHWLRSMTRAARLRGWVAPLILVVARGRRRPARWLLPGLGIALAAAFAVGVAAESQIAGDQSARSVLAAASPLNSQLQGGLEVRRGRDQHVERDAVGGLISRAADQRRPVGQGEAAETGGNGDERDGKGRHPAGAGEADQRKAR
jgi:hypothetical protein